ncbi:hypothetical protein SLEP1_g32645 [Rubroshorea leprosula]|uniref:Uncharacterized protein n=1 Tax=Rubroshorea leprosula TaxID=152421 RepID=A0AAV5KDZ5_9ROSI|nr:hypothetical protein SLEP1_g32645 [Rubroshorea leprosula]
MSELGECLSLRGKGCKLVVPVSDDLTFTLLPLALLLLVRWRKG